jgi:hypothetical protein
MPEIVGGDVTQEQALTDLLVSIALEEAALAHLINAEAEKVQLLTGETPTVQFDVDDLINVNESVRGVVVTAIKMQMLLQFKLERILDFIPTINVFENTATATGFFNGLEVQDTGTAFYSVVIS